jgi:hypothetical protein
LTVLSSGLSQHRGDVTILDEGNIVQRATLFSRNETVVVHCYTTPVDIENGRNLAALGHLCRKLGRETRQGEIGLVVDDESFAIRDFTEGATT